MDFFGRQQKALEAISREKVDALIVTHLPNIRYLCGFTGSAGVLVGTPRRWTFFTDGRYTQQAHEEVRGARVSIVKTPALTAAVRALGKRGAEHIGIEAEHMTMSMGAALKSMLDGGMRVRQTRGLVEAIRMVKETAEIERIRAAVNMGAGLLDAAVGSIRPGIAETHVAAEIEYAARKSGAEGMSFDTIVASGPRSALPHGRASEAAIPRNGFVVMDFGVILAGYCSDMTRTAHVGRVGAEVRRLYDTVREAQQAGIDAVRAGADIASVDRAARSVLTKARYGKYFTHSTGHGVGLEIHEAPRIARGVTGRLEAGMVITIEPGAYVSGKGGVRIEDMVLVTESGCEVLTPATKELMVV
ncbi:MAG TPA: Xaa-Pro peptidase family protein [Terriglobales bacterium]|jgi:Xaa-Pro aminopeptidase|nr:Xaa-Pro peptidase family protein [Terriglobales bacterium]